MRIISIVGLKNTGKTSLTGKIIKELTNREFKVASIKHSHHQMEMDHEGTDTYKQMEAGSGFVVGIGGRTYFNINERFDLERILFLIKLIENPDFVVIEGFKAYPYAKMETLFVNECGYNDASLIGQAFAQGKLDYNPETQAEVNLAIDGVNIGLNRFVSDYLKQTILGVLTPLKIKEYGVENFDDIDITIKNKKE